MATLKVRSFPDTDAARSKYLRDVDAAAEQVRDMYLTPGPGQAMTYEEKYRQALAGGGTMIAAEAQALEITDQEVIDSVLLAREQWEQVGGQIEAARVKAKKFVRGAQTPAEMHAILQSFEKSLPTGNG